MSYTMYMLKDGQIVRTTDFLQWAAWREEFNPTIAATRLSSLGLTVSTVFLGIDHNMQSKGSPILFEAAVFKDDGETDITARYATASEARKGHDLICTQLMKEADRS